MGAGASTQDVAQVAAAPTKSDGIEPKLDVTLAAAAGTPNATVEAEKAVEVASLDTRNDAVMSNAAPGAVVLLRHVAAILKLGGTGDDTRSSEIERSQHIITHTRTCISGNPSAHPQATQPQEGPADC